ncbi:hypothetical protein [Levilactobacillus namurensis]|uniref:hypothetical protein n=1 Tax=Levilactobacillus namurensis TaxID=380393 RepID=UPI0026E9A3A8|nr:hypothetical protein [Levilactobacillus namurensis]
MERQIQGFMDAVENDEVHHFNATAKQADFYVDPDAVLAPLAAFMREQITADQLAQATLTLSDAEVSVRLEMSVINLPMQDSKTIGKIMDVGQTAPINIYAVIETDAINVSGLRIDALAPATTYLEQAATADQSLHDWVLLQIDKLKTAAENAAQTDQLAATAKKAATKKATTKKTAAKKTTAKKAPAKKRTTRKAPAKKATTTKKTTPKK